jgi:hypothetical protein
MSRESAGDLLQDLWLLAEHCANRETVGRAPSLLALEQVVAIAAPVGQSVTAKGLAAAAIYELSAACDELEGENPHPDLPPNEAKAAQAALGLLEGTAGRKLRGGRSGAGRLAVIAKWLDIDASSVARGGETSRLHQLLQRLEHVLLLRESVFVAERVRLRQASTRPANESVLHIDWLREFRDYAKLALPLSGLFADLRQAIDVALGGSDPERIDYYQAMSLYYFAWFSVALRDFEISHGALWVLPTKQQEDKIAEATVAINKLAPYNELGVSVIRMVLRERPEVAEFVEASSSDTALTDLRKKWNRWIASCCCDAEGASACGPHRLAEWAEAAFDVVEDEWHKVADFYGMPRQASIVTVEARGPDEVPSPDDYGSAQQARAKR